MYRFLIIGLSSISSILKNCKNRGGGGGGGVVVGGARRGVEGGSKYGLNLIRLFRLITDVIAMY